MERTAKLILALASGAAAEASQATDLSWFNLPQTPGPTGDFTGQERPAVLEWDTGVAASASALDAHVDYRKDLLAEGTKPMPNTQTLPLNAWTKTVGVELLSADVQDVHGTKVVQTDRGLQPAVQQEYWAAWQLEDRPRKLGLLVEDMIEDYRPYVGYLASTIGPLVAAFKEHNLPVWWSNWLRRPNDGYYGALDRYYGPNGIKTKQNPMFVYGKNGSMPMTEVAPTAADVAAGRMMKSLHLSKFIDRGADGHSLFLAKLKAEGVDTLVITGAWTEDCILATAFEAADRYNLDVVVLSDAVGTPSPSHFPAIAIAGATVSKILTSAELLAYVRRQGPSGLASAAASAAALETAAGPGRERLAAGAAENLALLADAAPSARSPDFLLVAVAAASAGAGAILTLLLPRLFRAVPSGPGSAPLLDSV